MKKRAFLSLFVLLAVVITLAATATADTALPATCPQCKEAVTWTELSAVADDAAELAAGHYYYDYAESSHAFTAVKEIGSKVCLYLPAGKTLNGPDRVFTVSAAGELSVMGEGTLAGIGYTDHLNGGTVYVDGGTLNLLGGTLTTNLAQDRFVFRGGVIYMNGGTFNMSGGSVENGKTNSTLTSTNGANGGNIHLAGKSVMNMTAGTVSGGTVTGNKYGSGGNLYVDSSAKVEMSGGSITGGSALAGGTGCVSCRGVFTISGDAHVDIFRPSPISSKTPADTFAVSGKFTGSVRLNLVDGYIGVDKAVGKAKNDADISGAQIVACDLKNKPLTYYVEVRDGELVLATNTKEAYCEVCGSNQAWQRLDEEAAELETLAEGHYYLAFASGASVWTTKSVSGKVCLDLNGMDIQGKNRLFTVAKNAIFSIQGEGNVTGGGYAAGTASANRCAGVAYVYSGATLNIYGGTYNTALYNETDLRCYNGGAFWCQGTLNIYDGSVSGDASNAGDAVFLQTNGKLNVYGGTLTGDVYAKGSVHIANNASLEEIVMKTNDLTIEGMYSGSTQLNITDPVDGMVIGTSKNADLRYADFWVVGHKTSLFVTVEGDQLKLSKFQPTYPHNVELKYCEACDKMCHFVELTEENRFATRLITGHYYLNFTDGEATCDPMEISGTDRVCLDLNGNTWNCATRAFHVRGGSILNVMDSKGGGKITGQGTHENTPYGGVIFVRAKGSLSLYGGTLEYIAPNDGRKAVARGGVIYSLGDVNVYSGTVTGGKAAAGGNIYIDATSEAVGHLRMFGGTVDKGTATSAGVCIINRGYVTLSGDPQINQIRRTTSDYSPAASECLTIEDAFTGSVELYYAANTNGVDIGNLKNADISKADIRFASLENAVVTVNNDDLLAIAGTPAAIVYKADEKTAAYDDLNAAIAEFDGTKILLLKDAADVTVAKDTYIDLNGFDITGSVTGEGTLYVMDSKTADFTVADGVYGTVTKAANVKPVAQGSACSEDGYLMIEESGKLSFHRVSLNINSMSLRSEEAGVYFNSDFAGDEMVKANVSTFGVKLSVEGDPAETDGTVRETSFDAAAFNTGAEATSSLVYGIMKQGNTEDVNKENAAMQIYGRAYVRFADGTELLGACRNRSLVEQCAEANKVWAKLKVSQKRTFMDMFYQYESVMRGTEWSVSSAVSIAGRKTLFAETDYTPYLAPWTEDVVAKAKADGKIHYYFMAGEGLHISDGQTYKDKWGDAALIVFPDGQTMLVDSGPRPYAPVLAENLKRMGITHLDYMMVTHPHGDHQNGLFSDDAILNVGLIDTITIDKILWRGGYDPNDSVDCSLTGKIAAEYGIPCEIVERGDVFQIGDVRMEVVWPNAGDGDSLISGGEEINSMSIVMRFDYGEHSALFTGDLYVAGELEILERVDTSLLKADFLKIPHHAYNTSSAAAFLNAIDPDLAVATGRLPVPKVVYDRYEDLDIEMLDDRIYGYIHVTGDATGVMTTETSRTEFNGSTNTPEAGEDEVPEEDGDDA